LRFFFFFYPKLFVVCGTEKQNYFFSFWWLSNYVYCHFIKHNNVKANQQTRNAFHFSNNFTAMLYQKFLLKYDLSLKHEFFSIIIQCRQMALRTKTYRWRKITTLYPTHDKQN
jgi:hypothetical protein